MHVVVEILWVLLQVIFEMVMAVVRWFLPTKYKDVKDEICLITGAGSGIGRLMALEFAKRGAIMVLWDLNVTGNEETAEKIRKIGWKAFTYKCDVSKRKEVYEVAQKVREDVGDVTILVNNAGIVYGKSFDETTDEEIERTIKVNSLAHFWTVRAFLPYMKEKNHGHIVSIASIVGLVVANGMPAYVTSKHAAVGFCKTLEGDLLSDGFDRIKTTLVCPYHIKTGMFTGIDNRFPQMLPSLTPDECVTIIMHAVLTNRRMVIIPRRLYMVYNMITWIPEHAFVIANKFLGTDISMKAFRPTRSYQKETSKMS